ncbi:protein NUCLEAR FUSION DEFECTIVE 4 [Salvia miltiorrhiza]|uniref:protein NUCLEAR FUSION DEFECTIVE 4 n=1 Tax=Salvia miltiorrhiza TaxID=226208 RepID=UPI0025AD5FA8|nr:protein NUCLEAR FUSION DEFECTIVE 4 [Salvia miltiorrhiza]
MPLHWLGLVAAVWLQSINGTNSNFPAYSSELKRILSISQLQLNNLAFASDAGKLLGWVSGVAAARLPLWLVLLIGSALGAAGYGVQFLFLTGRIHSLSYWQVFSLTVVAGNSICWINTVSYILAIRNFPLDRQIAVGISTSYVGLSAKIYTTVVEVAAASPSAPLERAKAFLLLNAALPLLVCVAAAPLTGYADVGKSRRLVAGFVTLFVITAVTGGFAVITSLIPRVLSPPAILIGLVVFLVLPLVTPAAEEIGEAVQQKCLIVVHDEESLKRGGLAGKDGEGSRNDGIGEEIPPLLMLRRAEFWLYFLVYLFGATLGLVYLNNLGQIAESRGSFGISSLVSLASAFSFFGRLLPSLLDYFFSKSTYTMSTSIAMGLMTAPMSGAFFLLVISKQDFALYTSSAIVGICSGAVTSISISATRELFGTINFGVNHNILVSNIPIGSFLFGDFAALLYKNGRVDGEENCVGNRCYQTTLLIWGCLCVLGSLLALVLHVKTKKLRGHK